MALPALESQTLPGRLPLKRLPLKRLTPTEIQGRREKGLCYYCDEKYSASHKCKNLPQLLLLTEEHDTTIQLPELQLSDEALAEELQCLEVQEHSSISFHALNTLWFVGHVKGSPIQVLVDGGSTDNFIQTRIATFLQLTIEPIPSFYVMVGSGQRLRYDAIVRQIPLTIQGCELVLDFYVLALHDADFVLRVSWLATLGPVLTDYAMHVLEFSHNGSTMRCQDKPPTMLQPVQLHSLHHLASTNTISSYFRLELVQEEQVVSESVLTEFPPTDLQDLLTSFVDIFQKPQGLPSESSRSCDPFATWFRSRECKTVSLSILSEISYGTIGFMNA
uniref:Uncharacterized protein n=1 Tax=Nicotiana tabacum TaxID=4097 RepID=A0A1S3ZEV4_TOBAC|nr:PREDICTED: uncharacterized protein LOC107785918 [Nicotiana tabacum]XP_016462821.1 PREDICTED: uncharacterized protein LOC107785918 [Nicotiana tabacum]XP_016462822.1 PREDICTED: uncharacterized protein LOC107785918 [Nicotiana tabacum]XP_016462823.1 PREDICTED: uncharacterized protein LOC107785918 [Nicotiana tabacum]XP_016462824.1 PREDICTED: uncharacterized protein LOC107785918 [Nicotiana tabacum]